MKTKKILSLVLAISMFACIFIMPVNATETEFDGHSEIIIENENISEETQEKLPESIRKLSAVDGT